MLDLLIGERMSPTPLESGLERRFASILQNAGQPPFRRQVDLGDEQSWICRADFVDDPSPTVVFIDGATYHLALLDRRHDDAQTARLVATGLTVVRFSDANILYDAHLVLDTVRRLRAAV